MLADELRAAVRQLVPPSLRRADVPVRLAGELHVAGALCDVVALLAQAGRSGTLVVANTDAVRALALDRGELVGASTTAPAERIGEVLYRSGEIARDDIDEAAMVAALDGRLFGEVLVSLGRIERDVLDALLTRQAEEIFYAALRVEDGVFCFVDDSLGVRVTASSRPGLMSLLMEAARRMDEMLVFRERVPSSSHVPVRSDPPSGHLSALSHDQTRVLEACDGARSVAEIGREAGLLEFEVTRAIHELALAGRVEVSAPRIRGSEDVIAVYNEVLADVHRRCDRLRCGDDLRRALERFVACSEDLRSLLGDVVPHDDGTLDATEVLRNAGVARRDATVKKLIGSYVDFAVFHAGSLLPCSVAAELPAIVARVRESVAA